MKTRNKFEESGYKQLNKANVPFLYEEMTVSYVLEKDYIPDFTVFWKPSGTGNGKIRFIVEFKGYFRAVDQVKMKAVKRTNPELDIRFVFQDSSKKIRKGAKLNYGEWATKNGFVWAEGKIPPKWLKE